MEKVVGRAWALHDGFFTTKPQRHECAVKRRWFSAGDIPARQIDVPAGSNRDGSGGNEAVEALDVKVA